VLKLFFQISVALIFLGQLYASETKRVPALKKQATSTSTKLSAKSNVSFSELELESFEGVFPPDKWSKLTNYGGSGWAQISYGDSLAGFEPAIAIPRIPDVQIAGNAMAYCSWVTGHATGDFTDNQSIEQLLITPLLTNVETADTLTFFLKYYMQFSDSLDIRISTTVNNSVAAFDVLVDQLAFSGPGNRNWRQYRYALADYVTPGSDIYVAFHEHVDSSAVIGDALLLDLTQVAQLVTSAPNAPDIPDQFSLAQNYPNPFNPATNIRFNLPLASKVTLNVYNTAGQLVAQVVKNKAYSAGSHVIQFSSKRLPSGVYFYQLNAKKLSAMRKMLVIK